MGKWPTARFEQAMIALTAAVLISGVVFFRVKDELFHEAVLQSPYDGQDGLAAFLGALHIGFYTLIGSFVGLFVLQRVITAIRAGDSNSPTE